jgi:putative hydrolase of the HAD superfamily
MSARSLSVIAFDADDTLWQNEHFFRQAEEQFAALLADYAGPEEVAERLLAAEQRNLAVYGFGIKGFTLSMIETAIAVSGERAPAGLIREIVELGREMLAHPVELLAHVPDTLTELRASYRLLLVTKGDLFDQERKLEASGLADHFAAVEIVSDKTRATYERIFTRHGRGPAHGMMVGNSLKSDVVPAIEAGGWGVHVPHPFTWALEHAEVPEGHPRFRCIAHLGELPGVVRAIADSPAMEEREKATCR